MPKRTGLSSKRTGFSMQKTPIKAKIGSKRAIRRLEIATGNTDLGHHPGEVPIEPLPIRCYPPTDRFLEEPYEASNPERFVSCWNFDRLPSYSVVRCSRSLGARVESGPCNSHKPRTFPARCKNANSSGGCLWTTTDDFRAQSKVKPRARSSSFHTVMASLSI